MNDCRKIEIRAFILGYIVAYEDMGYSEDESFTKAVSTAQNAYSKLPVYRSALAEVLNEFSTQK